MGFAQFVSAAVPLLILAIVLLGNSSASVIEINSFECTPSEELCQNITCSTTMSRNRVNMINCGCLLPRPLYNLTADLRLQRKRGGHYDTLVRGKENLCDIARRTNRLQVMARVFEHVVSYLSSFKCPFQGNITATNVPISLNFIPGFLVSSDYRLLVDLRNLDKAVMAVEMNFSIGKK